ncbi:MAG: hypothetical protein ABSA45_10380 [Verrucomicrobiota bacterium]
MQDFLVACYDRPIFARRRSHPAQYHTPIREPDHIGLAVEIRVIRGRPGDRNKLFPVANRTGHLSRSLADTAGRLAGTTTNLAFAIELELATLIDQDFSEVMLANGESLTTVGRIENLPQNVGWFSVNIGVSPNAFGKFQTRAGTIDLAVNASRRGAFHHACSIAGKADFFIRARPRNRRRRIGGCGSVTFGSIGGLATTGKQQRAKKKSEHLIKRKTLR